MKISDLEFKYPDDLIAQSPSRPSRVMQVDLARDKSEPQEITIQSLLDKIPTGDVLVINDTRVLKRRVFADQLEILFLNSTDLKTWEVLFPAKKFQIGEKIKLPLDVEVELIQKGRPQILKSSRILDENYFQQVAELPLPPYIQRARNQRHTNSLDESWYQTAWSEKPGSFAAPTASLHFSNKDLEDLKNRGVKVEKITLHVGLGTFLPVTTDDLDQHEMHAEYVEISNNSWQVVQQAKQNGNKIWSLGTTATRALESQALGFFPFNSDQKAYKGLTQLLIQPGFNFQVVDRLLTNFHQPQSTLLALVAAFSGLDKVKACYSWAIERKFKLFSYGDLSVWLR